MERRLQVLKFLQCFDTDFEASLVGLSIDQRLIVTGTLRKVIPLFVSHEEGYYDKFYAIFEKEILEKLRHKAKTLYQKQLTDYLDQDSWKFADLRHELGIPLGNPDEQFLTDQEYAHFIDRVTNLINLKHELLLIADPDSDPDPEPEVQVKPMLQLPAPPPSEDETKNEAHGEREEFMNIEQCAEFLDCTKVTIHEYKKKGMPFYRIGRTVKFKLSEVLNFMRQWDRRRKRGRTDD